MGVKALRGVANGLLGTFVSRNNDINGYWGLGVLRLFAETHTMAVITLDMLNKGRNLTGPSPIQTAEGIYQEWFNNALQKSGIHRSEIAQADISIRFSTFDEFPNAIRDTRGEPYECSVSVVRVGGRKYSAITVGVCAPHDPTKDLRSSR